MEASSDTTNVHDEYAAAWLDYKNRVRWFFGVWLGGFVIIACVVVVLDRLSLATVAFWILGPAWMISFVVVSVRLQSFKCPRCKRWFFAKWWYRNPLARKCVHCKLPKWSLGP